MKNAFILKGNIYSFIKANVGVYIETCYELECTLIELQERIAAIDLEAMIVLMYCSLRDRKELTIQDLKELDIEEFALITEMFQAVNK